MRTSIDILKILFGSKRVIAPPTLLAIFCLISPICTHAEHNDTPNTATVYFLRYDRQLPTAKIPIHICYVSEDTVTPIGTLNNKEKVAVQLPPGVYEFVLFCRNDLLTANETPKSYISAKIKPGGSYFIHARFTNHLDQSLIGMLQHASYHILPMMPFKSRSNFEHYSLASTREDLLRTLISNVTESQESLTISEENRERILKSFEELKKEYRANLIYFGNSIAIEENDFLRSDISLKQAIEQKLLENVPASGNERPAKLASSFSINQNVSEEEVSRAIILAARHREYEVYGISKNRIELKMEARGFLALYTIDYDSNEIRIYSDVSKKKHPTKNVDKPAWSENLAVSISFFLKKIETHRLGKTETFDVALNETGTDRIGSKVDEIPIPNSFRNGDTQHAIISIATELHYTIESRTPGLV